MIYKYYFLLFVTFGIQIYAWGIKVTGNITDSNTNTPIVGANICLYNANFITSTDVNGDFIFEGVPEGNYTIIIDHPNYVQKVINEFVVVDVLSVKELNDGYKISVCSYPNPFVNKLNIQFSINEPQNIVVEILDLQGRVLEVVENNLFDYGEHTVVWNGTISEPGAIYFYRIRGDKFIRTEKIIKMK